MALLVLPALAQSSNVHGTVTDETGAVVPNATVTITSVSSNAVQSAVSDRQGNYSFSGLAPDNYILQASAPDLASRLVSLTTSAKSQTANIVVRVQASKQNINVEGQSGPSLSLENGENASSTVLRGKDLESLGDSQEDLANDLQALAGPSAGPKGGALYVDGFSGGTLPTKTSIKEVRINQNPFSPEYDKVGYGRIDLSTKAGAEHSHGASYFNLGDSLWNSRDPYTPVKAFFRLREYGGDLSGPMTKKLSFRSLCPKGMKN